MKTIEVNENYLDISGQVFNDPLLVVMPPNSRVNAQGCVLKGSIALATRNDDGEIMVSCSITGISESLDSLRLNDGGSGACMFLDIRNAQVGLINADIRLNTLEKD